jgi:serine/threonine-protein kinase
LYGLSGMSGENAPARAPSAAIGGKYRPIATLGQGGMATVYLTVMQSAPGVNKLLVVKALKSDLVSDAEFVTMFIDEARLAARLNHPNVVQTYEIGDSAEGPFLVMEYLEGQALHAVLPRVGRTKMSLPAHLWVLTKVLAGLQYAHDLRDFDGTPLTVVHRDVSPQNIFVCYDGQVKVLDFGIAKAAGSAARTETGVFKGKLGYISPEQITGEPVDHRADIFSVGVMMWEALTWRRLTAGDPEAVVLSKRTSGHVPKVRDLNPEAPQELARICERALSLKPEDRFPSAHAMLTAIEEYMHGAGIRVGDRDVGHIVAQAFATERGKIRSAIEAQLASATMSGSFPRQVVNLGIDVTGSTPPPGMVDTRQAPLSQPPGELLPKSVPPPDPSTVTVAHFAQPAYRPMLPWIIGGALAAAIGIVSGIVIVANRHPATPVAATSSTPTVRPSTTTTAPTGDVPIGCDVQVRVTPMGARLTLDGAPLAGNPFHASYPRDGTSHTIRASAPGYATEERAIAFDRDTSIEIALHAAGGGGAIAPQPTNDTQPGMGIDIKKDPRTKHNIDEKDPYK